MIAATILAILSPPIDIDRSLRFLQSIKPAMTLAQVKKQAGKGVTFGKPEWVPPVDGSLMGFVVRLSGPIQGTVSFLNKAQRQLLLKGKPGGTWYDGLPVFGLLLTVDSSKKHDKAKSKELIDRLAKRLGKPTVKPEYSDEWANDFGGWTTTYRLGGRDAVFYQCNFGEVESRLELLFQQPLF